MMRAARARKPEPDLAADFQEVMSTAIDVLSRERALFLSGQYAGIEAITVEKVDILARLEDVFPTAPRTQETISAIQSLVDASRRNEEIIQAARQGLAHARRRINSIRAARHGVVAYAEDGTQISSQADLIGREKSA